MRIRNLVAAGMVAATAATMAACSSDADVVSNNISKASDNFEIVRRVVFMNGITDKYMLEIVGNCSIKEDGDQLEVTCKVGDDAYKKHYLGLSDNVTYFVEQIAVADVSSENYRVTFNPSTIIPDIHVN